MASTPLSPGGPRFLGLAGYYLRSVKESGTIVAPLMALLKKEGFAWTEVASVTFSARKSAVTTAPVLALPDFAQPFVVECDASTYGFGAVLQGQHSVAFFIRPVVRASRWRHMKWNSVALCSPFGIGAHTFGDDDFW